MSPTAIATTSTASDVRSETVAIPRLGTVMRKICAEARAARLECTHNQAQAFYGMLFRAVKHSRRTGRPYRLKDGELYGYIHQLLEVVMPDVIPREDFALPRPGSAHELIALSLLSGQEIAINHTKDGYDRCIVAVGVH